MRSAPVLLLAVALAACGEVKPIIPDATGPDAPAADAPVDTADPIDAIDAVPIDAPPSNVTVTIVRGGSATGRITSDPAGVDCGATCTASFAPGTLVTLQAAPDAGADFAGWGGACSGMLPTCSVVVNANTAINANFDVRRHGVLVSVNGMGTVRSTAPAGLIDCPGTCAGMVNHGTTVTLAATATPGSTFLGWSGACTGTGACSVNVTAATQVSAAFGASQSLVVTRTGAGSGTVTGTGINCGTDCAETYAPGTMVTLTATAAADSVFAGWSGACTNVTGTCTVTINAATTVNAIFNLRQFTLTVTRSGTGTGTITATGINCGMDCTESYNANTMVTLQASPAMDSTFDGWTGDCTGIATCTVTMSAARNVGARFTASPTVTLTLSVFGGGRLTSGQTPISGPISCTSTENQTIVCSQVYNRGTQVGLRITPSTGFALVEIHGCTLVDGTCNLTLDTSRTVSAYFCRPTGSCPL